MITFSDRLPNERNRDYAYRVIKRAIMSLELEPGKIISEIEIAARLNISRTPVREVIARLKEENLVEVTPQVGTYVTRIKPQLVEEAVFTRVTLEKELLKLSCEKFPDDILFELKQIVLQQEQLLNQKKAQQQFHDLDKQFHFLIFKGNKKENVWLAITRLSTHYNRIRVLSELEFSFEDAITQHRRIIEIIETKAVSQVNPILDEHIIKPMKVWRDLYNQDSPFSHYFERTNQDTVFNLS